MNAANKLLDKYIETCKHASDSAAARALKVQPSAVNNWRHERAHPDAESVARMCEATGESIAHWLPLIEADRARNPEARKVWLRLAQAAACVALMFVATTKNASAAQYLHATAQSAENVTSIHYAQSMMALMRDRTRTGRPDRRRT